MLSVHGQMAEQSPALNNTESQDSPFSNCAPSTRTKDKFIYYLYLLWQYLLHVQVKLFFITVIMERNAFNVVHSFYSNCGPYNFKMKKQLNYHDFLVLLLVRLMYILKDGRSYMCYSYLHK